MSAYLDGDDTYHSRAEALLAREIDDDLAASSLTLAEVLVVPVRENRLDAVREALRDLELRELPFPPDTAAKLAELRASTNLKMPDCCVLLAAEDARARLASFDDRLADAAATRALVTVRNGRTTATCRAHRPDSRQLSAADSRRASEWAGSVSRATGRSRRGREHSRCR